MTDRQSEATDTREETAGSRVQLSIWELAWPSVLSNLLFSLTGLVATKVVA